MRVWESAPGGGKSLHKEFKVREHTGWSENHLLWLKPRGNGRIVIIGELGA